MTNKQWMKDNLNLPIVVIGSALLISFIILSILGEGNSATAATSDGWKEFLTGTIIDVDPMVGSNGCFGLFMEMENSRWIRLWGSQVEGAWPTRDQKGTFYEKKERGTRIFKWVMDKSISKKTILKKSISKTIPKPNNWKSVIISIPPINKTMLVKYKNGKTITTAYINSKGEWKLETNRERILGGKTIRDIKEWKEF